MADPGTRLDFPDGSAVFYVDETHAYYRCKPDGSRGKRLTGVTTAIKPLDFRPDNLMRWAANLNCDGVAELASAVLSSTDPDTLPDALAWLETGDGVRAALEESELTWQHLRDRAATRGTNVHARALGALAEGKAVPDLDDLTDEERGYAQGVVKFWLDHDPEPTHVEQVVFSDSLGIAGRFDLRAKLSTRKGICLIDAKTSRFISDGAHAQVALYDHLARECGIGGTDHQLILRLAADGSYELIECQADHEDALLAVDLYRRAARIGREARKARKAAA